MTNRRGFFANLRSIGAAVTDPLISGEPAPKVDRPTHQKFWRGDLVRVCEGQDGWRGHGLTAVVCGSYVDQFGGERCNPSYTLYFPDLKNRMSWYYECELTLIEPRNMKRLDLLDKYQP